ncbi:type VI secretion system contractile sheath large subunit, partial [Piscirickettsia salmonis]
SENAKLVTNLAYTMSVTRIAHYVKRMMRDNIGSSAEQNYIQKQMTSWVNNYVSEITNPDDITIGRFPFKKADVSVTPTPGEPGWFHCSFRILPHIQFEWMNAELRLDTRLDGN